MNSRLIETEQDPLLLLRREKELVRRKIRKSGHKISGSMHSIFAPQSATGGKTHGISQMVSSGIAIYEGVRIGVSFIKAFRSLFARKRRRRF